MIHKRTVNKIVQIKTLFDNFNLSDDIETPQILPVNIRVNTPYGYKNINHVFRTAETPTVTTYFKNNTRLNSSVEHNILINNEWKQIKNINNDDYVTTKTGITQLKKQVFGKSKSLYEIAVEDVHCYYSNEILSHNSWMLSKFGSNAAKLGKKVLHITLELKDIYTAKRYDSLLTGIPFDDLKFHEEEVKKVVTKLKGQLYIKEYPPSTLSLIGLETLLEKFKLAGITFDEVIIDYPELMKIDFTGVRDDNVLKQLYNDLTGLAGRFNFALWVVDQSNRESSEKDIIGNSGISNAFSKVFIATVVMSLSRKIKDKMYNTARLHLSKSRLGPDGLTFPCKFDTYNALIEVYHEKTETGKKVKEEMKSDHEYEMEYARKQFERFEKRKESLF